MVFLLTEKLATRRTALAAAGIHICYPSFIAFSHYLWSETTYIFLVLAALYAVLVACGASTLRRTLVAAGLAGVLIGLGGLTRATVLPFLLAMPVFFFLGIAQRSWRFRAAAVFMVTALVVMAPWLAALYKAEGRFVPLTTQAGYNLYLGNNPWVPSGLGSSWGHAESKARLKQTMEAHSVQHGIRIEDSARLLATDHIRRDPGGVASRAFTKLRILWTFDFFALRHLFRAVYPPLPSGVALAAALIVVVSYLGFIGLVCWGFLSGRAGLHRQGWILALVIAGMAPPLITIAMSRLHQPLLALLLPVAGHGLANLAAPAATCRRWLAGAAFCLFLLLIVPGFGKVISTYLEPSSFYYPVCAPFDTAEDRTTYSDRILLHRSQSRADDSLTITIVTDDYRFADEAARIVQWSASATDRIIELSIRTLRPHAPLVMTVADGGADTVATFRPVDAGAWGRWCTTGLDGVEFLWARDLSTFTSTP